MTGSEGTWIRQDGPYNVKKFIPGKSKPDAAPASMPVPEESGVEKRYGEKQSLTLDEIRVGDHIHMYTSRLSLYVVIVTAIGPGYVTGSLVHSTGSVRPEQARSITIDRFPITLQSDVQCKPVFETTVFRLGLDDHVNLDLFQLDRSQDAHIQDAIQILRSGATHYDALVKALDVLIESGRQINDFDAGIRANPGQERQKITMLLNSFNAAIDGIDHASLQRLLDAAGVTKAYGLDTHVATIFTNMLPENERKKRRGNIRELWSGIRRTFGN